MTSILRTNAANTARTKPTTGDTKTSFVIDDHLGWIKCDGRSLNTTAYNLLFQVIGYTFGGSGASFNLPDPQGRVMGSVGTVVDDYKEERTYAPGDSVGELDHKLILSEIPSHNHDDNSPPVGNSTLEGNTSTSYTGITDSGHQHTYINEPYDSNPSNVQISTTSVASSSDVQQNTGTGYANIVDPGHRHQIASNGGDQYHNNIQPTLFYGNTFIYSGVPMLGYFPFTVGRNPVLI